MTQAVRCRLLACLAVCSAGFVSLAQADSVTYVLPNLYQDPNLIVCSGDAGYASPYLGKSDAKFENHFGTDGRVDQASNTFLQVNLQAAGQELPEGAVIQSAHLEFLITSLDGTPEWTLTSFDANGQLYCWETPADFATAPPDAPDPLPADYLRDTYSTSTYTVSTTGANSINVTSLLQERVAQATNPQWFGLFITQPQENSHAETAMNLGNLDTAQVRLVVTYDVPAPVPEPATMSLLGLGVVGFAVRAYRRRAKP